MPAVKRIAPQKLGRRLVSLLCNILSKRYLNVRGHVGANVLRLEGPAGAHCRCDCDGYRPDTLGVDSQYTAHFQP